MCAPMAAPTAGSEAPVSAHPPRSKPSRVSSSGRPGPCITPSRVMWLITTSRIVPSWLGQRLQAGRDVLVVGRAGDGVAVVAGGQLVGGDADGFVAGSVGQAEAVREGDVAGAHHGADLHDDPRTAALGGEQRRVSAGEVERGGVAGRYP